MSWMNRKNLIISYGLIFLINKLKYINVLLLLRDRCIIFSHCFTFNKKSKRCSTCYILNYILIICGNVELNPSSTSSPEPTNASIISKYDTLSRKVWKFHHLNGRSLSSKIDGTRLLIEVLKPDLFCVRGSWLNCDISDSEVEQSHNYLLRNDRSDGRVWGGIAHYVRRDRNFEFIFLKLKFKNKKTFYVSPVAAFRF
jgi:hypothetical protein